MAGSPRRFNRQSGSPPCRSGRVAKPKTFLAANRRSKRLQRSDQLIEVIDDCIRAQFMGRLVAIAIGGSDDRNAGRPGCGHIVGTVPDKGETAATTAGNRFVNRVGFGFCTPFAQRIAANNGDKPIGQAKLGQNIRGKTFELVGYHGHPHAKCGQDVHRRLCPWIRAGVDCVVLRIIGQ